MNTESDINSNTNLDVTPPPRRGCSCWLVLLVIISLVLSGAVVGFILLDNYVMHRVFGKISAAEIDEYQDWMNSPVEISPELLVKHSPLSEPLRAEREAFFAWVDHLENQVTPIFTQPFYLSASVTSASMMSLVPEDNSTTPSIYQNLLNGDTLPADQKTTLSTLLPVFASLAADAASLTSHPDYLLNDRPITKLELSVLPADAMKYISVFAITEADADRWDSAISTLDTAAKLVRRDPHYTMDSRCATYQLQAAHALARRTSDTSVLRQVLTSMVAHRNSLLSTLKSPVNLKVLTVTAHRMHEDNFIQQVPRTRGGYFEIQYDYPAYMAWVKKHPADPRVSQITDSELRHGWQVHYESAYNAFRPLDVGVLKPLVKQLSLGLSDFWYYNTFKTEQQYTVSSKHDAAAYDLFCIELASRIAVLEGNQLPDTPGELAPNFLPRFPFDPFGSGPMPWSTKLSHFYSIGEDATAGTHDDITYDSQATLKVDNQFMF